MTMKYFEYEDADFCYTAEHFYDMMRSDGTTEMDVFLAEREIGTSYFWCREHGTAFEKGDDVCGTNNCESYIPRNGKNGICKFNTHCYRPVEVVTLKLYPNG